MISASSVIAAGAKLGKNVRIGAFCVVGENVSLSDNVTLYPHSIVTGNTHLGAGCTVHPFAVIGADPQAYKAGTSMGVIPQVDENCRLLVGENSVFREHCTVNVGSTLGEKITQIGSNCLLLAGVHVGHDCRLHDRVVLSNGALLAGHVCVGSSATIGGQVAVRQFVNIGKMSMIGGSSAVDRHVPPFALVTGNRAVRRGVNLVGLRRRGIPLSRIRLLQRAYVKLEQRTAGRLGGFRDHVRTVAQEEKDLFVQELCRFLLDEEEDGEGQYMYRWGQVQKKLGHVL